MEQSMVELLMEALTLAADQGYADEDGFSMDTFETAGLLTSDEGFVVRLGDGRTFQVSVVEQ
jgi:hypothetical protein